MEDNYKPTFDISLLEDDKDNSLKIITPNLEVFLLNNNSYFNRCLTRLKEGKQAFKSELENVRKILFSEENLIHWLHKIKKDAVGEVELILHKYEVSRDRQEENINFEKIGYLIGIYTQADKFLSTLWAIEPINKNIPHYTILDRLEELDNKYLEEDIIPGYYKIQSDVKIKKHKYEVKNLDEYWKEYLSLKDKYNVSEDFGGLETLLQDYHREFLWQLVKFRPREEVKKYLSFHFKNYDGESIDFLNHIEFRGLPELDSFARNDYPIYKQLIKEWLKEKRFHLSNEDDKFLCDSFLLVLDSFLTDIVENRKRNDENKYNIVIKNSLNHRFASKNWYVDDQSIGGVNDSKSKASRAGVSFRDFIVVNQNRKQISAIESFRLKYVPREQDINNTISSHLFKIFRNDPIGVSPLFIIVYCETKWFSKTWDKYYEYVSNINFSGNYILEEIGIPHDFSERANIKFLLAKHRRESSLIDVYHLFVNMFP